MAKWFMCYQITIGDALLLNFIRQPALSAQATVTPHPYSTVTLLARFFGLSTSQPRATAM